MQVSSLLESLRARLNAWQAQVKKKAEIEKQIADLDSEMKRLDAVIETQSTTPVSYTHLDVYKRQVSMPSHLGMTGMRHPPMAMTTARDSKRLPSMLVMIHRSRSGS